nr:hypothetical protein [Roseomonas sp. GC11]
MPDPRAGELATLSAEEAEGLATLREVFAGTALPEDAARLRQVLRARAEIRKEWGDARDSFLAIGRTLLELERSLSREEWQRLRQGTERLFPFSDATATQLRQIARAVESGRLPAQDCPGSYGTAYQLTLLNDRQWQAARAQGLIRPDVTRREIQALRQALPAAPAPELQRLRQRRAHLLAELAGIEARIAALEEQD